MICGIARRPAEKSCNQFSLGFFLMSETVIASPHPPGHSFTRVQSFLRLLPWLVLFLTLVVGSLSLYQALQAKDGLFKAWVTLSTLYTL